MKQDLLKDAIAEAKKVKATALANARLALQETFTPSLQNMISAKIAEEEGDDDEEDIHVDVNLAPGADSAEFEDDDAEFGFGGGEEEEEDFGGEEEMEEGDEYDFEDDELEEEINRIFEDEFGDEEELEEGEEDWSDPIPDEMEGSVNEEDEYGEDDELTEAEARQLLRQMREEEGDEEEFMEGDDYEGEEELTEDDGAYDDTVSIKQNNTEAYRRKVRALTAKLNEAYRAISTLKGAINEVNLLNAKLMYNQKINQQFDLSKPQKIKVIESFDRANTVREVQGKYQDMLSLMAGRKSQPKRKQVTEGSASKPIRSEKAQPLNENYNFVTRMQQLAGLKKIID